MTNLPKDVKPVAEKLYILCNCSYIHLRLKERHHWLGPTWNSKYKVSPILHWLEKFPNILPKSSFILYTDAFSTGMLENASNIVQRFTEYKCEMLVMSSAKNRPPNRELA